MVDEPRQVQPEHGRQSWPFLHEDESAVVQEERPHQASGRAVQEHMLEPTQYGFSDEDGTLRQVDGMNWRRVFGKSRAPGRFVPVRSTQTSGPTKPSSISPERSSGRFASTLFTQGVFAATLFVGSYFSLHAQNNVAVSWRQVMHDVFSVDQTGVVTPALTRLVHFGQNDLSAWLHLKTIPVSTGAIRLHVPLSGTIIEDYSLSHPEVWIEGTANESVLSAGSGTVDKVAQGTTGWTVEIDHGTLGKSWYVGLGTTSVQPSELVSAGEIIGRLSGSQAHPVLRFSLVRDGKWVNPHDDIAFPDTHL